MSLAPSSLVNSQCQFRHSSSFAFLHIFSPNPASPAREKLGDFSPAVSQLLVRLVDDPVFLLSPGRLLHLWVEVVVPALAALLADTPLQVLGDHRPALGSILLDQLDHLVGGRGCELERECRG